MDWKQLLLTGDGRIGRKSYWQAVLLVSLVSIVAAAIDGAMFGWESDRGPVSTLVGVALIFPQLSLNAKRLHDLDRSGWLQLLPLAVLVVAAVSGSLLADVGGSTGSILGGVLVVMLGLAALALALWIGFARGTNGPNRYGEPESGSRKVEPMAEVFS